MAQSTDDEVALPPARAGFQRLALTPSPLALLVLGALAGAYVLTAAVLGGLAQLTDAEGLFHLERYFRLNLVLCLLIAFTLWTHLHERGATARDLRHLRPILYCSDREYESLVRDAAPARRGTALAGLVGSAFGAGIQLASIRILQGAFSNWSLGFHDYWGLFLMLVLFGQLGRRTYNSLAIAGFLSDLGRRTRVRLLDPAPLRPYARVGMRFARHWFIGSAIAMLLFVDAAVPQVIALVIALTLLLGVATLLLPSRGIHERLRQAKQTELARVRRAIEQRGGELFDPAAGAAAGAPELPALLAWEARIGAVRVWPFDTPTLVRFSLFVLIPLASWLGGAVVERLLDLALS